jgi:hypothetical protein
LHAGSDSREKGGRAAAAIDRGRVGPIQLALGASRRLGELDRGAVLWRAGDLRRHHDDVSEAHFGYERGYPISEMVSLLERSATHTALAGLAFAVRFVTQAAAIVTTRNDPLKLPNGKSK